MKKPMIYMTTPANQIQIVTLQADKKQLKTPCLLLLTTLFILMSISVHAGIQQPGTFIEATASCTLYQVAVQSEGSKHKTSLHCEDKHGFSYEIEGPVEEIFKRFHQTNQEIEKRLLDSVIHLTGIKVNERVLLNVAMTKLRQQMKHVAHPQMSVSQFHRLTDKIILGKDSNWSVFWNETLIGNHLDAYTVADMSALLAVTEGLNERTALVVHVTANDFSTTASPSSLGDSVFGTSGDPVNLASQYTACSYSQLNFMPAQDQNITAGVVQLSIDMDVEGVSRGTVRNEVIAAGNSLFGSLFAQADHIMFALPPNTDGNWIAYASVNGSSSVYNNNWATYVSAQMHELGHNLGMGHSGIGSNEYADTSGMMGYSYSNDDGPVMCFNSAKSSKFAWYNNKELTFFESDWTVGQNSWTGKVIGLANYGDVAADQQILLKIHTEEGNINSSSLNINFNRDAGINSGTRIGKDRLMVVSTNTPTGYNITLLEADLGSGESQTFNNFWSSGSDLIIAVNDTDTDSNGVLYAEVEISVDFNLADLIYSDGFEQ